ncbi:PPE domain-containing protein [Rhodococcus sp. SJ-2]
MSDNDNPIRELLTPLLGTVPPESVARRQARHDELAGRVGSGVDPDYIAQFENFHGMEHAEIYQLSQTISPLAMSTLAHEWRDLGTVFSFTVSMATAMIRDKIAQHWEGGAAEAASSATELFGTSAQRLSDASLAVSQKLAIASDVGARVKSSVAPPSASVPLPMDVLSPVAAADRERQQEAARQQAIRIMESLYKPYYRDSGSAVPVLPPPQDTAGGAGSASAGAVGFGNPSAAGTSSSSSDRAGAAGAQQSGSTVTANGNNTTDSSDSDSSDTDSSRNTQQQPERSEASEAPQSESARTSPTSTTQTSALPGNTTAQPYGSSATGSGLPGSGGYGSSGGGSGVTGGGGGGGSTLGPGAVGGVGAAAASAPAASQQGTAAARSGAMRPMGMYPGMMAGQQRGNDEEQRVASYLVTNDHGNELIGSLPDTAPPVLGVDPL